MSDACWFCGGSPAVPWLTEEHVLPMCQKHSATTTVALHLRATGEIKMADMLDDAIGIDTRPEFAKWIKSTETKR